jgi:hypothetical protein
MNTPDTQSPALMGEEWDQAVMLGASPPFKGKPSGLEEAIDFLILTREILRETPLLHPDLAIRYATIAPRITPLGIATLAASKTSAKDGREAIIATLTEVRQTIVKFHPHLTDLMGLELIRRSERNEEAFLATFEEYTADAFPAVYPVSFPEFLRRIVGTRTTREGERRYLKHLMNRIKLEIIAQDLRPIHSRAGVEEREREAINRATGLVKANFSSLLSRELSQTEYLDRAWDYRGWWRSELAEKRRRKKSNNVS